MNFRDVELLSAYLDGQTNPSDSTRLESRLKTDPELASAYQALRESRGLLRRLPKRRAPRDFRLTYAMVGRKPPLPRSYPVFRFATAIATLLFALSFVANGASRMAASAPQAGYGMGGGGDGNDVAEAPLLEMAAPAATEAPVATEEPPAEPGLAMIAPTATPETIQELGRTMETPAAKETGEAEPGYIQPSPAPVSQPAPFQIPAALQTILGVVALLGAGSMIVINRLAAKKWRGK
jgi:hypothetical protein